LTNSIAAAEPKAGGAAVTIMSSSIDTAADTFASLADALSVQHLCSVADFPAEVATLQEALAAVEGTKAAAVKMHTDAADATGTIKTLVCPLWTATIQALLHIRECIPRIAGFSGLLVRDECQQIADKYPERARVIGAQLCHIRPCWRGACCIFGLGATDTYPAVLVHGSFHVSMDACN
jgi:hypothetical protein